MMTRLGEAIALGQQNDRGGARALLEALWSEVGSHGDPLHRCAIAHHLADAQDELTHELAWDLEALRAVKSITDDRLHASGAATTVEGLLPSLHLNLADVYRRLGDQKRARQHLELGRRSCTALPESDYGAKIREALDRVAQRLSDTGASPSERSPPSNT